jgi:hypothetical protein
MVVWVAYIDCLVQDCYSYDLVGLYKNKESAIKALDVRISEEYFEYDWSEWEYDCRWSSHHSYEAHVQLYEVKD